MSNKLLAIFTLLLISIMIINPTNESSPIVITGAGSTFAQVILNVWDKDYNSMTNGSVLISYSGVGSGQGIASILNQSVYFGASDAPLNSKQQALANSNGNLNGNNLGKINTLPESAGGIVLSYNLKTGLQGSLNLTAENIADIFQGNITSWNNPALKTNNPGLTSNGSINVVHRSESSGTTYAFSDYLTRAASTTWKLGRNTLINWPSSGIGSKGNAGVANTITNTKNSIGYVELAYALQNKMSTANIKNKDGFWVNATLSGIKDAVNSASAGLPDSSADWSSVSVNDQSGPNTYPICTLTYLLVYGNLTEYGAKGVALIGFLKYIMSTDAQNLASSVGYVPLPLSVVTKNLDVINAIAIANISNTTATSPGFEFTTFLSFFIILTVIKKKRLLGKYK